MIMVVYQMHTVMNTAGMRACVCVSMRAHSSYAYERARSSYINIPIACCSLLELFIGDATAAARFNCLR